MRKKGKKFGAALMTGVLCFTVLSACSPKAPASSGTPAVSNAPVSSEAPSTAADSAASQEIPDQTSDMPPVHTDGKSLGEFTTRDVNGKAYTQDIFRDYDLTMINVFATWCSPCVAEMPDLEKLHQMMADKGVNVMGIVLDVLDENAEIVQEDLERAQLLVEQTGVTYPVLLPDPSYMNGYLTETDIEGLPFTFFVDRNGHVVGESYCGSGSLEDWMEIVEQELANLKGGR